MGNAFGQANPDAGQGIEKVGSTLDQAAIGDVLSVQYVEAPRAAPEWARWLEEIGFIVGERVMLMARGLPGGDPLVVRIGQSTFALRRAEAACVRVISAESRAQAVDSVRLEGGLA